MVLKAIENYWGAIRFVDNPSMESKKKAISLNEEAINYINYTYEELVELIEVNINVVKYVYNDISIDLVVDILTKKVREESIDEKYLKDFLNLEVLEMDKINFINNFGSKTARKILVDYKLSI